MSYHLLGLPSDHFQRSVLSKFYVHFLSSSPSLTSLPQQHWVTCINYAVPWYVISIVPSYPAQHNLLHFTIVPTPSDLCNYTVSCCVISIPATYTGHRDLPHISILTKSGNYYKSDSFSLCHIHCTYIHSSL
jgi:hypothetical protein